MSMISASCRPLALRMRPDLVALRQRWQGREYWTVKDPLALRYYRFEDEEYAILSMLDGQTSIGEIRERFEKRFAPQRLSAGQLQHLLSQLHRSNLLVSDAADQGEQLLRRDRDRRRRQRLATMASFLAIRFRGVDPDGFLTWLNGLAGWLFSLPAAIAAAALALWAVLLVAAQFDTFCARLPTMQALLASHNWLWLAGTLGLTKVLHEIGHGLACKRFGGECHEMGLMLLVFTPCLYCNVSDAWTIPNKWRRAAIGAAGMYVELILAAVATLLWWVSEPGLFHSLCLNVMFLCSVSTLLFNANPLMRFDGYYILSDLIEVPNLRQKSTAMVQRKLGAWIFGTRERPDPFLPARKRWLLALYGVASPVYGWLVMLSIFWFLYRVLEPHGLKIVGQLLALAMILGLIVVPLVRLGRFVLQPARRHDMNKRRAGLTVGGIAFALVSLACVPLPYYVPCPFEVQPRSADSVYVDVPGELREVAVTGGVVAAGQSIARLDDIDARLAAARLTAQRDALAARIEGIRQRAHTDDSALLELAQTEEALAALDEQVLRLEQDLARLTIRSPQAGIVVPAPSRSLAARDRMHLASWSGRALDARNVGAYLEAGTVVCRIAQPGHLEAILAIDQSDLDFVHPGQTVDLFPASLQGSRRMSQIERIAEENLESNPGRPAGRSGGQRAIPAGAEATEQVLSVVYQASVPLEDPSGQLVIGTSGLARVHAGWQPLWQRLWRAACRTFRFEM